MSQPFSASLQCMQDEKYKQYTFSSKPRWIKLMCVFFPHSCRVNLCSISGPYTCKSKFHIFSLKIHGFLQLSPPRGILSWILVSNILTQQFCLVTGLGHCNSHLQTLIYKKMPPPSKYIVVKTLKKQKVSFLKAVNYYSPFILPVFLYLLLLTMPT